MVTPPPSTPPPPPLPPAVASMTLLAAAVIVHDRVGDRVLLLQRGPNAKFARGSWDLPVGKCDPGEPIARAAARELYEETGLRVDPAELRLAHVVHGAHGAESPNGYLTVVFTADRWQGEPVNAEPAKHAQVRWFARDEIPTDLVVPTAELLAHHHAGEHRVLQPGWA